MRAAKAFMKSKIEERGDSGIQGLKEEVEISRKLSHKNLVEYIETYETENSVYVVYEYLEGLPITRTEGKERGIEDIRTIMRSILEGLEYLGSLNLVHRDIKPYNILFGKKGDYSSVKIVDFGLTCFSHDFTATKKICGTPGFIAPEMFVTNQSEAWKHLNSKIDIFSSGVIFHRLLFGKYIYEDEENKKEENEISYTEDNVLHRNKHNIREIGELNELEGEMNCLPAYDLMTKMLQSNPQKRITVKEALNHPFFKSSGEEIDDFNFEMEADSMEIPEDPVHDLDGMMKNKLFHLNIKNKLFPSSEKKKLKLNHKFPKIMDETRISKIKASDLFSKSSEEVIYEENEHDVSSVKAIYGKSNSKNSNGD